MAKANPKRWLGAGLAALALSGLLLGIATCLIFSPLKPDDSKKQANADAVADKGVVGKKDPGADAEPKKDQDRSDKTIKKDADKDGVTPKDQAKDQRPTDQRPTEKKGPADKGVSGKDKGKKPPIVPPVDPRVLTVSQKPEDGGQFRTIKAALDVVEANMTIRVLDNAEYDEALMINDPNRHPGLTLEAAEKATIRRVTKVTELIWVRVPRVTVRGFNLSSIVMTPYVAVFFSDSVAGSIVENLEINGNPGSQAVAFFALNTAKDDPPIVVQKCVIRDASIGVQIEANVRQNRLQPKPLGNIVLRNNEVLSCDLGIALIGAVQRTHIVGNRVYDCRYGAIDLDTLLSGTSDILIANNTLLRNNTSLRIWNEKSKVNEYLQCKNVRIQSNLILSPLLAADFFLQCHEKFNYQKPTPGQLDLLQKSTEWRFSHNWRELIPPEPGSEYFDRWIPPAKLDQLRKPILVSAKGTGRIPQPEKDTPLATGGAGKEDPSLPPYVGAVPPEGTPAWDWGKTWDALVPKRQPPNEAARHPDGSRS